jgi:hypothetical protein
VSENIEDFKGTEYAAVLRTKLVEFDKGCDNILWSLKILKSNKIF